MISSISFVRYNKFCNTQNVHSRKYFQFNNKFIKSLLGVISIIGLGIHVRVIIYHIINKISFNSTLNNNR